MTKKPKIDPLISNEILTFLTDRRARMRSSQTIKFYELELGYFQAHMELLHVTTISRIDVFHIREYMISLADHRNAGGVHAAFRAIKAFLNWWAVECDDPTWRNPIRKITPPTLSKEPLSGVPLDDVRKLIAICAPKEANALRDKAIFIALLDTGLRKSEFVALNYEDLDFKTGAVQVRSGKGSKARVVYLGARARRDLLRYFRTRGELSPNSPVWAAREGQRLTAAGLRQVVRRRAEQAHINEPQLHDFRRTFAIECLRNKMDLVTLMHLMGHTTTDVLRRYLKLVERDLQDGHENASPADKL
jgi:site-specific recombinase XerD